MPFRHSAQIKLVYDGPEEPGDSLWQIMPCYSYVMVRTRSEIEDNLGYFHAYWKQEGLLLGTRDYLALEAKGLGKFVGWNFTVRRPGRSGYPVDENAKFYIDGEAEPSVELQGIEDSFGFSWGFPPQPCQFPYTGYFPFMKGAMAYRFFANDSISFEESLRVTIGFGKNEDPMFHREYSKEGNELQLSTVVYWYQQEPHAELSPLPPAVERAPAPENPVWPKEEKLPSEQELKSRGVKFLMYCGRPEKEVIFAEPEFSATVSHGYSWDGFRAPIYFCRAADDELKIDLSVPPGEMGTIRLFVIDADNFKGGRRQEIRIGDKSLGTLEQFQQGTWLEYSIKPGETAQGSVSIRARNLKPEANAVISIIEWVDDQH